MKAPSPAMLATLTEINLDDLFAALGWEKVRAGRRLLRWLFRPAAVRFAHQVIAYDHAVGELGLQSGSRHFLSTIQKNLLITGQENIPNRGPVLFLSNHPGMTDTVSLFASIPRPDLRIIAAERTFLHALPATEPYLIYVPEDNSNRMNVVRAVSGHLRSGGAVLTFPAGEIEPDPAVLPGAEAALEGWATSIGLFARLAPQSILIPVIVSGVLSPKTTFHPLTHLRRLSKDRERLGASIQIFAGVVWPEFWPDLWQVTVHIRFAPPIEAAGLMKLHDPAAITRAVIDCVRPFLREVIRSDNPALLADQ
jgi:hypothetical protein